MIKPNKLNTNVLILASVFLLMLSGCSSSYRSVNAGALPKIPEIRSSVSHPSAKKAVRKATVRSQSKSYAPKVKKYSITSTTSTVITKKDAAAQEALKMEAKQRSVVEIDPYASIPESNATNSATNSKTPAPPSGIKTSPAVTSLMTRARADLAIGRTQSAVSKLERGLRIESQNPIIWNLLAKAHYDQRDYQQTINMAKKSVRYSSDESLIARNWQLIKQAAEKSDDTIALKEALDYLKVNP